MGVLTAGVCALMSGLEVADAPHSACFDGVCSILDYSVVACMMASVESIWFDFGRGALSGL